MARPADQGRKGEISSAANQGKIVSWNKGQTVSDGPFAESKEAIGGYFLLQVGLEEALEIAKQCPGQKYGVTVEVRPIVELCASAAT